MELTSFISFLITSFQGLSAAATTSSGGSSIDMNTLISAISACVAAGGLIYAGRTFSQTAKSNYSTLFKDLSAEINTIEGSQQRNYDWNSFAAKFLNEMDRIAYLANRKIIPDEVATYFIHDFSYAMGIIEDPDSMTQLKITESDFPWKELRNWCNKQPATKPHYKDYSFSEWKPTPKETGVTQTIVHVHQLEERLKMGCEFVALLPEDKAIIKLSR